MYDETQPGGEPEADPVIVRVSQIMAEAGFEPMPQGRMKGVFCKLGAVGYVIGGVHMGIGEVHSWDPGLHEFTTTDPVEAALTLAGYVRGKLAGRAPAVVLTTEATLDAPAVVVEIPEDDERSTGIPTASAS